MAGKIIIDTERCKGCGLCVVFCPKGCIVISKCSNKKGFFPAETNNTGCTGCAICALVCPDAAIKVLRDDKIVSIDARNKKKVKFVKEKL